ncbi:MAG: class D beta-lactamase [Xanthomonadales bacterium]|nr:class D beta-lactamase [Xanthomonadales bacterium]
MFPHKLASAACSALAALTVSAVHADTPHWPQPLADYVGEDSACIAILDTRSDQYFIYNLPQCSRKLAPCSTFKVPHALIALETEVLGGPEHVRRWDGTVHEREVLNRDHDLASAIKFSVVWYFQDTAEDIGPERMQQALDRMDYGNRDISGGQRVFWLSSSLQTTAFQQIEFMRALDAGELPASRRNQAAVRDMILQDYRMPEAFEGALYGKTGSCRSEALDHGWFVGFLHRGEDRYAFAVNLVGEDQWGWNARQLAVRVLQDMR